ncbi:MAG TPA: hypothetical protein VG847_00765 [Chitinophagaceae bacterium]|nr:hypothetical protein [Chitinophagaceae bacterium]
MIRFFRISVVLGFIAYPSFAFSQKVIVNAFMENKASLAKSDTIYYDFNRSLEWADFKGIPNNSYFAGAVTASGFAFDSQVSFDGKNIYLAVGIYTFFTKHDSWHKPGITSAYHLLHEQHHFDITRLGAQKFLEEVQKTHFTKDNYARLLSDIFDKAYNENAALQHRYDAETEHSINTQKQLEWNNKIAGEIRQLKQNTALRN